MRSGPRILAIVCLSALAGCSALTSAYHRPALPDGPTWQGTAENRSPTAAAQWWRSFGDKNLERLVDAVLAANNDLLAASVRVRVALLQAERAGVSLIPSFSGSASADGTFPLQQAENATLSFGTSLGASYEIDLWGRISSEQAAARLLAVATAEDYLAARTTVIASTIEAYWRLAHANQEIAAAEQSLAYAHKAQDLVESQAVAGAVTDLERAEVRQTVENLAASLSDLRQARVTHQNTLTVLLNGHPNPMAEPKRLAARTPVTISAGLPSTLLARRPDLRAAEFRLRASLRNVDAARVSLLPTIKLTGSLGSTSSQLLEILSNPMATLGAGIALPFLNFRDGQLKVRVSEAEYELAVVEFRSTLLKSFSDTANALSARTMLAEKARRLRAALDAAQVAEKLTEDRYRAGAIPLRTWLDAQERRLGAERSLASNRLEQLLNEVQIFRVLGGDPVLLPPTDPQPPTRLDEA